MSRSLKAHILLIVVTAIWGTTFVVNKMAIADVSPLLYNALRTLLATACLAVFYWRHLRGMKRPLVIAGAWVGIFLWLGYAFQMTGLKYTTPSKSGFITGISVILVPLFMATFFKRRVNHWTLAGVVAAFAGMLLMTVPAGQGGLADWSSVNRGDVLTLGCAVAFAFQIIFLGRATQAHPFEPIAFLQTAVAAAFMMATVPLAEDARVQWTGVALGAIIFTGLFATAAAFTIQAWAQQFTPPTHTALIFALEPVFAWLTSYVVLNERLGTRATAGAILILGGVLVSELKGSPQETSQSG